MKWLQTLLKKHGISEEVITAIQEDTKDNEYIAKSELDKVNESLTDLQKQIKDRDTQLSDLGKKAKGNEELEKQIKQLQDANAKDKSDYESKIRNMTLDGAITNLLKDNKAKHSDLLMSKFDREKLNILENGTIDGLDTQFTSIKETYKDLFEQPLAGGTPNDSGQSNPNTGNSWQAGGATGTVQPWNRNRGF